jgi:hypothetical protein
MPRTTVNIDASVLREVKRRARAQGKSIGDVVSELVGPVLARRDRTARLIGFAGRRHEWGRRRSISRTRRPSGRLWASRELDRRSERPAVRVRRVELVPCEALELIDKLARGTELLYLFWPVITGYLRVGTHSAIFPRPLSVELATGNVEQLLALPHARTPGEGEDFWRVYRATTSGMVVRGNLVPDAHVVVAHA